MDLPVHDQILWHACVLASQRLGNDRLADPLEYFPILVRGSWLNDTNQVSVFTDLFTQENGPPPTGATLDDALQTVFRDYWLLQLKSVLERVGRFDAALGARCAAKVQSFRHAADFGTYLPHDHLDVLKDDPSAEYFEEGDHKLALTVADTRDFIETRLLQSTTGSGDRLAPIQVSSLGRALHSIADFFAHTNFVELFLWELAVQKKLDQGLVRYFNRDASAFPFEPHLVEGFFTPLPIKEDDRPEKRDDLLTGMWYGGTAASTPLVSCVFDTQDTIFSLVHMYANHLEKAKDGTSDDEINLVFSVIDVSGLPMPVDFIRGVIKVFQAAKGLLDAIGKAARIFVADAIIETAKAQTSNPTARALLETTGALIRKYESKEAEEWARAGKLRYAAGAIAEDLGERLQKQVREGKKGLPHHTILSKDHPPKRLDDRVRYNLACFFATELSAEVLQWYFGKTFDKAFYPEFRDRLLVHPSRLIQTSNADRLAALAMGFFHGGWQGRIHPSMTLADWRKP